MNSWLFSINSFLASGNFCHLLKTIANCLDLDQDVLIWIGTVWHSYSVPEIIFWKSNFKKVSRWNNSMKNYPACRELIYYTPANFVCGGYTVLTLSVCACVRPSETFYFLNILKSHCWIFIKPCKHVHICKTNTLDKKVRARGQIY